MIAYLVNQTAYCAKKPHGMTFHRSMRPKLPQFGHLTRQANFLDSPKVLSERPDAGKLTLVVARC